MKEYIRQLIKEQPDVLLKRSIVREYLQARILQSLQDEGAFLKMAFLGGTSLRFLYLLPRYSEDLDFSILPSKNIEFENLLDNIHALHIKGMDWKRALEYVSPFLEREGDEYLLTLENCNNLLSKFKRV